MYILLDVQTLLNVGYSLLNWKALQCGHLFKIRFSLFILKGLNNGFI